MTTVTSGGESAPSVGALDPISDSDGPRLCTRGNRPVTGSAATSPAVPRAHESVGRRSEHRRGQRRQHPAPVHVGVATAGDRRAGGYRRGEERGRRAPAAAAVPMEAAGLAASWGLLAAAVDEPVTAAGGLLFSLAGLIASWVDVDVHQIPSLVTGPAALILAGGLAVAAGLSGDWPRFGRALLAGVAMLVGFAVLMVLSSFGAGDAKLAGRRRVGLGLGRLADRDRRPPGRLPRRRDRRRLPPGRRPVPAQPSGLRSAAGDRNRRCAHPLTGLRPERGVERGWWRSWS